MNYIKEINAFMDWLEINPLEATTQTLWFHIMSIANKSGWPEWFTVANLTLMAKAGISENTLNRHRNILIQKGRIEYKNQGRQKAGRYKIIPFTSIFEVRKEDKELASNIEVGAEVNPEVSTEVSAEVKPSALYKLNKTKLDLFNNTTPETVTSNIEARKEGIFDEELKELAQLYQKCGFDINGLTPDWLLDLKQKYSFEWTKNALLEAERQGKRTKKYVEGILSNWKAKGGMTLSIDKSNTQNRKTSPKNRFHNFEQRSSKYSNDQLEDIAMRKKEEYLKKIKGEKK